MSRTGGAGSLVSGGNVAHAAQVFRQLDNDNDGALDLREMLQALKELCVLDGLTPTQVSEVLRKELRDADAECDGPVNLQDFQGHYQRLVICQQAEANTQRFKTGRKAVPAGAERNTELKSCFRTFCQYGKAHIIGAGSLAHVSQEELRMNARQFARVCKEAGLLKPMGSLDPMTADVIFVQCKISGDRNMSYKGFLEAMGMLAEAGSWEIEELIQYVANQGQEKEIPPISLSRSTSRKSIQRPSIVAKSWKGSKSLHLDGSHTDRSSEKANSAAGSEYSTKPSNYQAIIDEASKAAVRAAAKIWAEEKLELQNHITHLQEIIKQLQADTPGEIAAGQERSAAQQSTAADIKQDMEKWKKEVMATIHERMNLIQDPAGGESTSVNKLRLQVVQLEDVVSHMAETQASWATTNTGFSSSQETAPAADLEEAVQALEERALERQARLEAALIQVAMKVDLLEKKVMAM